MSTEENLRQLAPRNTACDAVYTNNSAAALQTFPERDLDPHPNAGWVHAVARERFNAMQQMLDKYGVQRNEVQEKFHMASLIVGTELMLSDQRRAKL